MGRDDNKIYVGNLPPDVREKEVTDIFSKYGKVKGVEVKGSSSRGPVFAFVEFGDSRDADDAIRGRDGYDFEGYRLRVEMTRGVGPRGPGGRPFSGGGRDYDRDRRDGHRDGRRDFRPRGGPPSKRTDYRVIIEGLPSTGSWQDLKDHMREAGEVCFADVARDGTGVVEFARSEDMDYAIKKLDDTKFKSHKGDTAYIRVREGGPGRGDRDRSRSPRRSPKYAQRSPSPRDSASPGHSRSRSRSHS